VSRHRLLLSIGASALSRLSRDDFLWRNPPQESSMLTTLGPRAEELGPVDDLHADFVRLATLVYLVDRTAIRGRGVRRGNRWRREFALAVPVSDEARWSPYAPVLDALCDFLTGDAWRLTFERRRLPRRRTPAAVQTDGSVLLFSGGADSLAGALLLGRGRDHPPALMSHWSWPTMAGVQVQLAQRTTETLEVEFEHIAVRLGRRSTQVGSGARFRAEDSSRSRALLFLALGFAAASVRGGELIVAENGYTSLNVPLGGERRGPMSTRTTHPAFLDGLVATLNAIGLPVSLSTPYAGLTKGQLFGRIRDAFGADLASELLSGSHSCSKPGAQYLGRGFSPADQCGLCSACLVRRAAFAASNLEDRTGYVIDRLDGDSRRAHWLTDDRRSNYVTVQDALDRGLDERDIAALGLPNRIRRADALGLARAGLAELALVNLDVT
jgi:7-cyano-7-deazaguanine synthase in queuosine biosynthesis